MNHTQKASSLIRSLSWIIFAKAASILKISFIIGSQAAFFSASSVVTPLIGAFNTQYITLIIFGAITLLKLLVTGSLDLSFFAFIIPGLCAALYWNSNPLAIRVCLPIMCMLLFMIHPIGFAAAPYAFFWLIPVAVHIFQYNTLFSHALSSTFIAHAVGSVIWLYTIPMTASAWIALMPIVCIERIAFASGMIILHSFIMWCSNRVTKTTKAYYASQSHS